MPLVNGLYYRVSGDGKPVVLFLHGAGGYHGVWHYYTQRLGQLAQIILVDLPGHGKSRNLPFLSVVKSSHIIFDALNTIQRKSIIAGIPDIVIGHSLGGMVGLHLVLMWQNLTKTQPTIVLISTSLRLSGQDTSKTSLNKEEVCKRLFYSEEWQRRCLESRRLPIFADFEVLEASLASAYEYDFRNNTHLIKGNVHLIYGAHDKIIPMEYFNEVRRLIPHCQTYKINNSGHMPHLEARDEVLKILCNIIKQHRNEVKR